MFLYNLDNMFTVIHLHNKKAHPKKEMVLNPPFRKTLNGSLKNYMRLLNMIQNHFCSTEMFCFSNFIETF